MLRQRLALVMFSGILSFLLAGCEVKLDNNKTSSPEATATATATTSSTPAPVDGSLSAPGATVSAPTDGVTGLDGELIPADASPSRDAYAIRNNVRYGLSQIQKKKDARDSSVVASVQWTRPWIEQLRALNDPQDRKLLEYGDLLIPQALQAANAPLSPPAAGSINSDNRPTSGTAPTTPATTTPTPTTPANPPTNAAVRVPYMNQYDNAIAGSATCQNTSIAMTLRAYGWNGSPDDLTQEFGRDLGKTPEGAQTVFNTVARRAGLRMRATAHRGSLSDFRAALKRGPAITYGWFTPSGHVVVTTGFNGSSYTVNDPGGQWNQVYKGSVNGYANGNGVTYSARSYESAIVEGNVWWVDFQPAS